MLKKQGIMKQIQNESKEKENYILMLQAQEIMKQLKKEYRGKEKYYMIEREHYRRRLKRKDRKEKI